MKACNECHVHARVEGQFCPLCGATLAEAAAPGYSLPQNQYPDLSGITARYHFIWRLLVFLSLLGSALSVLINLLVPTGFLWCLIVIAAVGYLWLSIPPLLRRGVNYAKRIVAQVFFTSLLVVAFDFIIGYQGWSVSYVVPGLLSAGIMAVGLMMVFNRTSRPQYIFYQFLMGLFGLVPLVLYLLGFAHNLVMVLITFGLGLSSVLITLVFGDRSLKNDFRRRFHF